MEGDLASLYTLGKLYMFFNGTGNHARHRLYYLEQVTVSLLMWRLAARVQYVVVDTDERP